MRLVKHQGLFLQGGAELSPGEPLWKIAPTHDQDGNSLCDFMVLIPRLKLKQPDYIRLAQQHIEQVLTHCSEVVFANMDMRLNLLWVSHRYRSGLMIEVVSAIRQVLPEAVLVAHQVKI